MRVPLMLSARKDKLIIHYNKKVKFENLPFKPFILCEASEFDNVSATTEKWNKVPDHKEVNYYCMTFDTMAEQVEFLRDNKENSRYIYNNTYTEQLFISEPDYTLNYANTNDLTLMFWDIETKTVGDGKFPKPTEQPILSIGYSIWTYNNNGTVTKIKRVVIDDYINSTNDDSIILKKFMQVFKDEDPDIIIGYYSTVFDLPYVYERCKLRKISMKPMGRDNKEPWMTHDEKIYINGRIHYDLYLKVKRDQSLFGMKSRNLKEVARHYKVPLSKELDIELKEDIENTYKVWKEEHKKFISYQLADVIRTEHVGLVYIRNDVTLAERLQVPLDNTMNTYPSFIPKILIARNMERLKIISTETNFSKYNSLTGTYQTFRRYKGKELKFQGAVVGIYKRGFFPMTYKIDFTSMYPSAICTFDLGPDTTKLVKVDKYTGKYNFKQDKKYNWYRIPDRNFNVDLIVRVNNTVEGFLKKDIKMLWAERTAIKNEMKKAREAGEQDKVNTLDSQQMAIKVILNSLFGMMALRSSTYGDLITACMITGLCRYTTSKVMQEHEKILILTDTDGLAINTVVSEDTTNTWLNSLIKHKFNIDDNYMQMELDEVGEAYFCRMKNYITIEKGITKLHGSALKSSRLTRVQDRARNLAILHIFNQKPVEEVIREAYDFSDCTISDFESRIRLSKNIDDYDDVTGQAMFLVAQVEEKTGNVCEEGTLLPFVVANFQLKDKIFRHFYTDRKSKGENYTFTGYINSVKQIDLPYYKKQIDTMLAMFNIEQIKQTDAFDQAGINIGIDKTLHKVEHDIEMEN